MTARETHLGTNANPGLKTTDLAEAGVSTPISPLAPSEPNEFSFNLNLNGSEQISLIPVGESNVVSINSRWPSPSFNGAFLPTTRAELAVSVVQVDRQWSCDLKTFISTNRVGLGGLTLTTADVDGLDRLLQFYRSSPRDGCTTIDQISISQRRGGKAAVTEQFTDGSCSYDRKDLTRITDLVSRLRKPK